MDARSYNSNPTRVTYQGRQASRILGRVLSSCRAPCLPVNQEPTCDAFIRMQPDSSFPLDEETCPSTQYILRSLNKQKYCP